VERKLSKSWGGCLSPHKNYEKKSVKLSTLYLTNVNGTLYFSSYDSTHGEELWKSDGTEAGTSIVKDIRPGSYGPTPYSSEPEDLMEVNGVLYFTAFDSTNGRELWKSDGTEAGTVMVKDIYPGFDPIEPYPIYPGSSNPSYLTEMNDILYFQADDGIHGKELWRSDGTEAGTYMVRDIKGPSSSPDHFEDMDGLLYFSAHDGINGQALWKSDGSKDGTLQVKDIKSGDNNSYIKDLKKVNDTIFISTYYSYGTYFNSSIVIELWKTDGTESGTVHVKGSVLDDLLYFYCPT